MGPKEQNIENPTVNEIRAGGSDRQEEKFFASTETRFGLTKRKVHFLWFFSPVGILPCFWQNVITARSRVILRMFVERDCGILAGKQYTQLLNRRAVVTKPIY